MRRIPEYDGPLGVRVAIGAEHFSVWIDDGRIVRVPYALFPRLARATPSQRRRWEWTGQGFGIHWPDVDEDIRVGRLVEPEPIVVSAAQANWGGIRARRASSVRPTGQ